MRDKNINALIAVLLSSCVLLSGCGQNLKEKTTLKKVKDITAEELIKENVGEQTAKEAITEDYTGEQSATIGGVKISLTCPDGWEISADDDTGEYEEYNNIYAWKRTAPKYELYVETYSLYYNIDAKNIIESVEKEVDNMTKDLEYDFDKSVINDIKEAYEAELKHEGRAFEWTEVSFEEITINNQVYVVAKGKIKSSNKKKSQSGGYWYITVRNGNIITFQFKARHPEIDASVIDIFEGIMEGVTYS